MEKIVFTCLSEDMEFIENVKKEFSDVGNVEVIKTSGITGYEMTMLVIAAATLVSSTVVPFIVMNMTKNKDDEVKSNRCIIDNKNKSISLEGCDEDTIQKVVLEAIHEQNK